MATPIEEPEQLTGSDVHDQIGEKIGSVKQLYTSGEQGSPSWVGIEVSTGMLGGRLVLVPLARLKHEDGQVRVPYGREHLLRAPEVQAEAQLSAEEHAQLSDYYAVGRGDQPAEDNPDSYAAQMPEESEPPQPAG
jgi:hypothetical protein